jgi:PHS family inorganic phosphate transporter-like MFS transporter
VFGRLADLLGRKRVYGLVALLMVLGAVASALSPSFWWLIASRAVLGLGIGGDYPVSAVLMSEYANIRDRGRLVGLVFSMQALGTLVGPVVGLTLLSSGMSHGLAWRIMFGLGALPALAVLHARRKMPESPRYTAWVQGDPAEAARALSGYSGGLVNLQPRSTRASRPRLRAFLSDRRTLVTLIGTAGAWFAFDYAYYGNSISSPVIVREVLGGHTSIVEALSFNLMVFVVAALPGYALAVGFMDRIGHRRLQLIGFPAMGLALLILAVVPGLTSEAAPFLVLFGLSYLFAEFGPNTTTFVLPSEVFPTGGRATGHGISSGVAKLGAFAGVYLFPIISRDLGLRGALALAAGFAGLGALLTLLVPDPSGRSLDDWDDVDSVAVEAERILAAERART